MSDTPQVHDDWGTESGLLEDYVGTVAEAWFGVEPAFADGDNADKLFLHWKMINIDADGAPVDEWRERFSIGNGWVAVDGGKAVAREDGNENRKFNENTDYGRVINRCLGERGGKEGRQYAEQFAGVLDVIGGGSTKDATIWEGLRFHMQVHEFSGKDKSTGEEFTWQRVLPIGFVGSDDGATAAAPTTGETNTGNGAVAVDDAVLAALTELAKAATDHQDFLTKAISVEGVAGNSALLERVADTGDEGIYAQANA